MLKAELDRRGLRVSEPWASTFFTVNDMAERTVEDFRRVMAFIKRMGGSTVVVAELGGAVHQQAVPPIANKPVFYDAQWAALVDGLNRLGRLAADAGMSLCYHHHMGTGVMTRDETDRLMHETDDAAGAPAARHRPPLLGRRRPARHGPGLCFPHPPCPPEGYPPRRDGGSATPRRLSFIESVMAGVFTVPGDGAIDFAPIFAALSKAGFGGWLMVEAEQDAAKANPLDYARKARGYIRATAGI